MKCISLWQPWATLMAVGIKKFETRSWPTAYRGPLAIHAAKRKMDWDGSCLIRDLSDDLGIDLCSKPLPLGCIIGVCNLDDCVQIAAHNMPDDPEFECGDYTPGRFMWHTSGMRKLDKPIALRGMQGLFEIPDSMFQPSSPSPTQEQT